MTRPSNPSTAPASAEAEPSQELTGLFDIEGLVDSSAVALEVLASPFAAFWMIDAENRTSLVNRRACDLLGYEPEEMIGRSLFAFMDEEGVAMATRNVERRKAGINELHPFRFVHRDGKAVWCRLQTGPVHDGEGEYLGAAAVLEEFDPRLAHLETLKAEEALLRTAVDNSPNGIIIVEAPTGVVRVANAAARAMLPDGLRDIVGRDIRDAAPSEWARYPDGRPLREGEGPLGRALLRGELVKDEELLVQFPSGVQRVTLNSAAPVRGPDGSIRAAVLVVTDITDRRNLEEERARLEQRTIESARLESLGRLAGGVAHDFNNLLATLMGRAELAMFQLEPDHPARAQLEKIVETVQRSSDLTRKMLAYSGRTPLDVGPVLMDDALGTHLDLVRSSLPAEVRLTVELEGGLPPARGDTAQLRHLVTELLEAAAGRERQSDERRHLRLRTWAEFVAEELEDVHPSTPCPPGHYVCIEVADDGPALSAGLLTRLTEPYPSGPRPGPGPRGAGYELTLILGIIRGHKGALRFRPSPSGGVAVQVYLPATEAASGPILEATSGLRMLVIDDEQEVRETLCELLEAMGHHPQGAASGREALSLCTMQRFDVCLLDLTMPDLDGAEVAVRLARIDPDLPVIVCSGWAPASVLPRFVDCKPAAVLQKPVMPQQLAAVVEKVMRDAP